MPREREDGFHGDRPCIEWRDPRVDARPHDDDVHIDRRDRELYRDPPPPLAKRSLVLPNDVRHADRRS